MVSMKLNKKSIFALGIFICFLICISHACAYEGVDNSTSLNNVVDNSHSSDNNKVLSVSDSDVSNVTPDKQPVQVLSSGVSSHEKLDKRNDDQKEVKDDITVGNFSLLNKELSDFNDNRYYKTIVSGRGSS